MRPLININSFMQFGIEDINHWIMFESKASKYFIRDWELEETFSSISEIKSIYKNIRTFTVIMNPWARAKYIFYKVTDHGSPYHELFDTSNFENFVLNWEWADIPGNKGTTTPQLHSSVSDSGTVDIYLRAETLVEDFKQIQTDIGVHTPFTLYADKYPSYKHDYTPEMIDKIYTLFREDIEWFSYSF